MAEFANTIGRADVADAMMPDQIIDEIIQEAPKSSILLSLAKRVQLTTKKAKQPVLSTLPDAYWVDGDDGLVETTKSDWKDVVITAEDLAVLVPIPNNLIDDANVPLWDAVKPLLAEAVGKKIDAAGIFGTGKPASWPEGIVPGAIAAGNVIETGTGSDLGADVAALGEKLADQGFGVNGFASRPGMQWKLVGLRNAQGDPIYTQSLAGTPASGLYGYPLNEAQNGSWDPKKADILAADWTKFVIGMRRDIQYSIFREGVISDASGKVVMNLMQQRHTALMVTMRVGFQVANPKTRLGDGSGYPAGIVAPSGYSSYAAGGALVGGAPVTSAPTSKNTIAEIAEYADARGISLDGCTNKSEMLAAIAEAE